MAWFRQQTDPLWDRSWCFGVLLRGVVEGPVGPGFEVLEGQKYFEDESMQFTLCGIGTWCVQCRHSRDYEVRRKSRTRVFMAKVPVRGKTIECRCMEGVVDVDLLIGEAKSFQFVPGGSTPKTPAMHVKRIPCRITLRLCLDQNWYYCKFTYAGREAGPGWQHVPDADGYGTTTGLLHLTPLDEEYQLQWDK